MGLITILHHHLENMLYFSNHLKQIKVVFFAHSPGYVYDELPPDPLELRNVMEEPIFVAFENIEAFHFSGTPMTTPSRK